MGTVVSYVCFGGRAFEIWTLARGNGFHSVVPGDSVYRIGTILGGSLILQKFESSEDPLRDVFVQLLSHIVLRISGTIYKTVYRETINDLLWR